MSGIDQYAYRSKISAVRVSDKLIFAVLPLIICLFAASNPVSLLVLTMMCVCTIYYSGLSMKNYFKLMTIPFVFLIVGILTIIVNRIPDNELHTLYEFSVLGGTFGVTTASLSAGVTLFLKALAAVSCMYFFSLNTPMNAFFNYLRMRRFPHIMIELMELMYRFIFVIWEEADKIHIAQSSRLGYQSFRTSIRSLGMLGSSIFTKAFGRIDRMNNALESRGFQGRFEYLVMEEEKCIQLRFGGVILSVILIGTAILEKVVR